MTIVPKRLGVKFNLKRESNLQPADIVPIFQRWIQDHTVEGMLIDVIDYKHVPEGPGILLIADEADFAYDLGDGQTGLHYVRKRNLPADLCDALRLAFRLAIKGAQSLEKEAPGDIEFDFSSAKISFMDRQHYRNDSARFADVQAAVSDCLTQLYGGAVKLERAYDDLRYIFAIRVSADTGEVDVQALLKRSQESRAVV